MIICIYIVQYKQLSHIGHPLAHSLWSLQSFSTLILLLLFIINIIRLSSSMPDAGLFQLHAINECVCRLIHIYTMHFKSKFSLSLNSIAECIITTSSASKLASHCRRTRTHRIANAIYIYIYISKIFFYLVTKFEVDSRTSAGDSFNTRLINMHTFTYNRASTGAPSQQYTCTNIILEAKCQPNCEY